MSTEPGKTLLRRRLVRKIGEGGMGEVWKAVDTDLAREAAAAFDAQRLPMLDRAASPTSALHAEEVIEPSPTRRWHSRATHPTKSP